MTLILLAALSCPKTIFINQTKDPWNDRDYSTYHTAQKRCNEIYEGYPCVKKFYKRPEQSYWVICGK